MSNTEGNYLEIHIESKKGELEGLKLCWQLFENMNKQLEFSEATYKDVQAKVSSKMNQIERSIRDTKKLLK